MVQIPFVKGSEREKYLEIQGSTGENARLHNFLIGKNQSKV